MLALRKAWIVLRTAWGAALLVTALLHWLLGLDGAWVKAAVLLAAVLGGASAIGEARHVGKASSPLPSSRR